ncbi:hypothetical protein HB662_01450 [Roseomonas frigidaquae]|uniref:Uncharacterized protein n=1 Tax=Falsiroseomonas frigidaquae TaxID=487318 RepID=A0ABX1ES11_9PROT|nr:hypothetical protein [Falsiroseomonas frigidaquae]NKE43424.1 hypothetical protein [Falsiroseomonas frigidaquae]
MAVKRAEAARILGVNRARITQYVKMGMPSLQDGSIDVEAARQWIAANIDPMKRLGWETLKRDRAPVPDLANSPWAVLGDLDQPSQRGFALASANAVYRVAFHAVWAAADAGVDRERARELAQTLQVVLWADLDHFGRVGLGIPEDQSPDGWLALQPGVLKEQLDRVPWGELFDPAGRSKVVGRSRAPD